MSFATTKAVVKKLFCPLPLVRKLPKLENYDDGNVALSGKCAAACGVTSMGGLSLSPQGCTLNDGQLGKAMNQMKVAVITPYYKEDVSILQRCQDSVATQTHPCTHFLIADGHPQEAVANWPIHHVTLPTAHGDNGNTPRAVGSLTAINQGFDALAYLDADNWYFSNHVETMVALHQSSGADVCTAGRTINRLDGSLMYVDKTENDGERFVDTSCLFLTRKAFKLTPYWAMMPKELSPVCDRIFWHAICARPLARAHNAEPTVGFSTQYECHYRNIGEKPPTGAKKVDETTALSWNEMVEGP